MIKIYNIQKYIISQLHSSQTVCIFAGFALLDGPGNIEFKVIAFKAVGMYWCVTQATGNWLMFINCHRKQGFTKLYEEINEISDQLQPTKSHFLTSSSRIHLRCESNTLDSKSF